MRRQSFRARAGYAFDKAMARGTLSLLGWFALSIGLFIVLVATVLDVVEGGSVTGLPVLMRDGLLRAFDLSGVIDDIRLHERTSFVVAMFVASIAGVFMVAILIGLLTTGMEQRLRDLRRGRSRVIESGHTLILGWSPSAPTIVDELVVANANQRRASIVILADCDPIEILDQIRTQVGPTGRTRIICRRGDPAGFDDLDIASFATARSIIIVPSIAQTGPDCTEVKTLLALTHHPRRSSQPHHVVLAVRDAHNAEVAQVIGGDEAQIIDYVDVTARIVAQTSQQPGLSLVYSELLQFRGDEIYFHNEPDLTGLTFGDALTAYATSTLIGIAPRDGAPRLNPPMDTVIGREDQIVAISRDDDTILLAEVAPRVDESAIRADGVFRRSAKRTLLLGWNEAVPEIVDQLDAYVSSGATLTVVSPDEADWARLKPVADSLERLGVRHVVADGSQRGCLERLDVPCYDHVIVCKSDQVDARTADAQALLTLLHLRHIKAGAQASFSIVTEMADTRNRDLAAVTAADDFIVSDHLVSLILAQVSENRALRAILDDLFDPEGSEIYMKPVARYVETARPMTFYTVVEAARRLGEIAVGYRRWEHALDASRRFGVVVNPDKSQPVTFASEDMIVVVAED